MKSSRSGFRRPVSFLSQRISVETSSRIFVYAPVTFRCDLPAGRTWVTRLQTVPHSAFRTSAATAFLAANVTLAPHTLFYYLKGAKFAQSTLITTCLGEFHVPLMSNSAPVVQSVHKSFPLPLGTSVYIRVLKIRPSAVTDSSDRIECDFSILDVDNGSLYDLDTASPLSATTPYTALSYTWGDTIADHDINLNGTPFLVRQNLWNFLDRARNDNFEGYLWIDALCIDQTEVGERNHQVALMGEIYSHAEGVIVWLGHVDGYIEDAMGALGRVVSPVRLPSDLVAQHLYGMQRFCELGYWSRAWM
jgi:hypothetical protein